MAKPSAKGVSDLAGWLEGKPTKFARELAARMGLRILPVALRPFVGSNSGIPGRKALALSSFRMGLICWVGAQRTSPELVDRALAADEALRDVYLRGRHGKVILAAIEALRAAGIPAAAIGRLSGRESVMTAFNLATRASSLAGGAAASETFIDSVASDISRLEAQKEPSLIGQQLWLNEVRGDTNYVANFPIWARTTFDAFDASAGVKDGAWGLWTAWYRAILPNSRGAQPRSSFGDKADFRLVMRPGEFWDRDPDEVVSDIAELTRWRPSAPATTPPRRTKHKEEQAQIPPETRAEAETTRPPQPEAVETHSDEPTSEDQLGRRPFAQALAERMDDIHRKGGSDGFAVHLHGPWGAGKTSILMMMREFMTSRDRDPKDRWAIVHFNAWRHERRNPPWWPLIETMKQDCRRSLWDNGNWLQALRVYVSWLRWRFVADLLPFLLAAAALVVLLLLLKPDISSLWTESTRGETVGEVAKQLESLLKVVMAVVAASGVFILGGRALVFGSANNAKFYHDLSRDPLRRISGLFKTIVKRTDRPICIFIDDLDRCKAAYVGRLA